MFEKAYRERVFLENLAKVELHNSQAFHTYKMGINQFSALTDEEFVAMNLGLIVPESAQLEVEQADNFRGAEVDWATQGAVTGVKNQGSCGSCWSFSTTGALEGLSKLAYGTLESFSEQQLVDCSSSYGNQGCNGGLMTSAFKFIRDHGIVHEDEYPYKGVQGKCAKAEGPFKISYIPKSPTVTIWPTPLLAELFQLPSMPLTGQDTAQESSTTVLPDLTTVLL